MTRVRLRLLIGAGLLVVLAVAGVFSYYASTAPDGLERVATDKGFAKQADEHALSDSPLSDYGAKGVENDRLSVGIAGVIGAVSVLVLTTGLAYAVRRRSRRAGDEEPPDGPTPVMSSPQTGREPSE